MDGGQASKVNVQLERFVVLATKAEGPALVVLIKQLLDAPGVYVFGEFLNLPCVRKLSSGSSKGYCELLNMFAYGTFKDYKEKKNDLPPLTEVQKNKLRHLTIVNLAAKNKCIPYSLLLAELELASVRQLEDVIIEALYADVIQGKLDHCGQQLEVHSCLGRDIQPTDPGRLVSTLQQWCSSCETVLGAIELQLDRVTQLVELQKMNQQQVEEEARIIQKVLDAAAAAAAAAEAP
ncbi:COP9 signalosome complex subunit 7b-like [Sardina pilchardus]|uniref:COP9 signalosome complex subunit 7b-like n=1 Tax=Sardina pilchardus TaxID=27697 RepID=UPI002E0D98B7